MKKLKTLCISLIALLLLPGMVHAASGTIKVTGSSTAVVGNQIKVTVTLSSSSSIGSWNMNLNYNKSYLSLISSTAEAGGTKMVNSSSGVKSKSYTFTFKALKNGSTNVSVGSYEAYANDFSEMSLKTSSLDIKIMTQQELEATYSKDNNLKALSVDGYELTPTFDKDTLEYKLTIPSDVTKVNIVATKNDSTATVSGDGEKEVVEGTNRFEIVVTAQNGSEKTYIIDIEVEDLNPIEANIENEEYTIVKRKDILEKPSLYEETTIQIDGVEIPAFYSEITGFTLVGLKDSTGKINLAIYNENTNKYTIYNEFKSNTLTLYLTNFDKELKGYKKGVITINEIEVPIFRYKDDSRFVICYGMNIETGEYDFYSYDTKEKTFQTWNQEELSEIRKDLNMYMYISIAFGVGLISAFILIICLLSKKNKKKKDQGSQKKVISETNQEKKNKKEEKQELLEQE